MATPEELAAEWLATLTGSATAGQYPSTVVDRLDDACEAGWALANALEVTVPIHAGERDGPFRGDATVGEAILDQTTARYRGKAATSRPRTLAERGRQIEALAVALSAHLAGSGGGPAPTPGAAVVPATARLVADLSFDNGDLSRWSNLQTRDRNGSPGSYSTYSAAVRDGGPGHPTAARFEVRKGDVPNFGGGERAEVRAPSSADVREGDERWYAWSTRFGDAGGDFRPPTAGWGALVMQWHAGDGSPPLALQVTRDGQLAINNNRPGGYSRPVCPIDAGTWHDYVLHVVFSRDARKGLVQMWRDGIRLANYHAATMGSSSGYLKNGLYRSSQPHAQVVWHDGLRIYKPS